MMRSWWMVLFVLFAPLAQAASATAPGQAVQAFLDRSHVSLGDTVTLNISSSGPISAPDLSPLQNDFQVLGSSRSSSVRIVNGTTTSTSQLGIALKPLHAGTLVIPSLDVGGAKTQPLTLQVGAAPSGGTGKTGDPVFMETDVLSSSPYVGQQTVYTVRLFYLPGVDGALGDPTVDGARLVQLDRDHRYITDRDGYTYKVIERSWALIPQRAGAITVQGPEFQGQQLATGNPNAWFNDPNALLNNPNALLNGQMPGFGKPVDAAAPTLRIDPRAVPAGAGKPWLPARDVQLKLTGLPANGIVDAGAPLTVTLSIDASGQPADALPEPELPPIAGARVYPDQVRDATDASGQWLQSSRTRSFAIVPQRNGTLVIPAITLDWWNVADDRAEQVALPAHTLRVSGVAANPSSAAAPPPATATGHVAAPAATPVIGPAPATTRGPIFWRAIALASLVLWLLAIAVAIAWWLRRRSAGRVRRTAYLVHTDRATPVDEATQPADADQAVPAKTDHRALKRQAMQAAQDADPAACERALLAWARSVRPEIVHAAGLRDALGDAAQRGALDALQRVRWQRGDAVAACGSVAHAFAPGFAWRDDGKSTRAQASDLPPLYPS